VGSRLQRESAGRGLQKIKKNEDCGDKIAQSIIDSSKKENARGGAVGAKGKREVFGEEVAFFGDPILTSIHQGE